VVDHDHAAAGQPRGEHHPTRQRGVNLLSDGAEEVDAAMTGTPGRAGRVEGPHHLGCRLQRPHPDRDRVHGYADRARWSRQGDEREQHGNDDQRRATADPDRVGT
jgi:hypothetical protein